MISLAQLYKIAILLCPVFASLFAILILFLDIGSSNRKPLKLSYYLLAYFSAVFLSWVSAILYFYTPTIYIYVNWMSMLAFLLVQVFYYGFIFEVTRTDKQEKFSNLNYIFPVLLSSLLLFASLGTPAQDQLNTILSKGVYKSGSKLFFYFNYSKILFRLIFSITYTALSFVRLYRYQKFIKNFSSNEEKNSLRWISNLLLFSILLLLAPLLNIFSSREEMVYSPIAIIFVISLLYYYVYICLHVIKQDRYIINLSNETSLFYISNYVGKSQTTSHPFNYKNVFPEENEKKTELVDGEVGSKFYTGGEIELASNIETDEDEISLYLKKNVLNRNSFDSFMKVEKPYLNADLRITDLVDMLHVNRTYISTFINREYGVNFSVFINKYRLLEYNALKELPEYCGMSRSELAEMAGFNSYRSFQRTEKEVFDSNNRGL